MSLKDKQSCLMAALHGAGAQTPHQEPQCSMQPSLEASTVTKHSFHGSQVPWAPGMGLVTAVSELKKVDHYGDLTALFKAQEKKKAGREMFSANHL